MHEIEISRLTMSATLRHKLGAEWLCLLEMTSGRQC